MYKKIEFGQRDMAVMIAQLRDYIVADPVREKRRTQVLNVLEVHLRKNWRLVTAENTMNAIGDQYTWYAIN